VVRGDVLPQPVIIVVRLTVGVVLGLLRKQRGIAPVVVAHAASVKQSLTPEYAVTVQLVRSTRQVGRPESLHVIAAERLLMSGVSHSDI